MSRNIIYITYSGLGRETIGVESNPLYGETPLTNQRLVKKALCSPNEHDITCDSIAGIIDYIGISSKYNIEVRTGKYGDIYAVIVFDFNSECEASLVDDIISYEITSRSSLTNRLYWSISRHHNNDIFTQPKKYCDDYKNNCDIDDYNNNCDIDDYNNSNDEFGIFVCDNIY